jgi:hypothetical protein
MFVRLIHPEQSGKTTIKTCLKEILLLAMYKFGAWPSGLRVGLVILGSLV